MSPGKEKGKEIYVWTVNTEESINRMIDLIVDNIITDDITLAKEGIYLSKTNDIAENKREIGRQT